MHDSITEIRLTARESVHDLAGTRARLATYDGCLPGPVLEAREGERLRVVFRNQLGEPSNLHLHGMRMPAQVDDPHRIAAPGESLDYEFTVPEGAAGTYWYHPHVHGEVARQLSAGLAGAMIVRGPIDALPELAVADEHVLVLQDLTLEGELPRLRDALDLHDGRDGERVLVNGKDEPTFAAKTGLLRLRVVNASSARFYDLVCEGAELFLIGLDAGFLPAPAPIDHLVLPPGQRADLILPVPTATRLMLLTRAYDRGVARLPFSRAALRHGGTLACFEVQGQPREVRLPERLADVPRLSPSDAVATRIFEYGGQGSLIQMVFALASGKRYGVGEGSSGPVRFWLNGREFEPGRIDATARLGTTELWELRNPTPLSHPFHLHIHPFQVLDVAGLPPAFLAFQDVVNVPARSTVRILVPFRDFPGMTMFHCHILEHEDNGMMGHLLVIDPDAPSEQRACALPRESIESP